MATIRFTKLHGLGNDYVYINGFDERNQLAVEHPNELARYVADRHFGIGGDGMILLLPPVDGEQAQARMRMFNVDGSEGEMCGNGVRCVCKLAYDHRVSPGIEAANPMKIETGAGVLSLVYELDDTGKISSVTVDMGEPILELAKVPVEESKIDAMLEGVEYVSMGNPHSVAFVDDVAALDLDTIGPAFEHHPAFPNRINAHWAQVHSEDEVTMRTWERGSGITLACGTGASAVCVAGVLTGKTGRNLLAHLPGGDLELEWRESNNHVYMTGPATEVFQGEFEWEPTGNN